MMAHMEGLTGVVTGSGSGTTVRGLQGNFRREILATWRLE
jgi:hypothetical protein